MYKLVCAAVVAALAVAQFIGCDKLPGREEPETKPPLERGPAAGIEGTYEGSGTNPDGTPYECEVTITEKGDGYQVIWYFDGQPGYEGAGILKGNTFGVGFAGASVADVARTYTRGGTKPRGAGSYDRGAVITKTGEIYSVQWGHGDGSVYEGVGVMKNGLLCVCFAEPENYSVCVYDNNDGSIETVWINPGAEELGTETLPKH
jgi:hypothetical protein